MIYLIRGSYTSDCIEDVRSQAAFSISLFVLRESFRLVLFCIISENLSQLTEPWNKEVWGILVWVLYSQLGEQGYDQSEVRISCLWSNLYVQVVQRGKSLDVWMSVFMKRLVSWAFGAYKIDRVFVDNYNCYSLIMLQLSRLVLMFKMGTTRFPKRSKYQQNVEHLKNL